MNLLDLLRRKFLTKRNRSTRRNPGDTLPAPHAVTKSGAEPFHSADRSLGFDLLSSWRWSASDLVDNTTRGVLAEYLAARALNLELPKPRQTWMPYDLVLGRNAAVEVKASAYLQAWGQGVLTTPSFDISRKQAWNHDAGKGGGPRRRHASHYVFALHAHTDKPSLDPMDVAQWRFMVVPTRDLDARFGDQKRVGLPAFSRGRRWVERNWTRSGVARWLVEQVLDADQPIRVGGDQAVSFAVKYFEKYDLARDWEQFLDDFHSHWPTDEANMYVDFVREGLHGNGAARQGDARWRRLTDIRAGGAKSVVHFDVPGSVAKSTHAGLPWLRFVRRVAGTRAHFWPFDGWDPPAGSSVFVEAYPSHWNRDFPREGRTPDQHDAWCVAESLRRADNDGSLDELFAPELSPADQESADLEGWILGVR